MPTPREIAAWRFEIVSFLTDRALDPAARSRRIRLIVRRGVPLPPSRAGAKDADPAKRRRISKSTLLSWLAAFRAHGISGLEPKPRRDRDRVRRHDATAWVDSAICLLYEQPRRSLTQLVVYLRLRFVEYSLSRSSLARRLRQHPAYAGLRGPRGRRHARRRLFGVFEADHPHHGWQLDGKEPLSVIDDFSRAVLAVVIAPSESSAAAFRVLKEAILAFGAPERLQCDKGSAFDSQRVRTGVALLGIHRNFVVGRTPEMQGKIERYHGALCARTKDSLGSGRPLEVYLEHLSSAITASSAPIPRSAKETDL